MIQYLRLTGNLAIFARISTRYKNSDKFTSQLVYVGEDSPKETGKIIANAKEAKYIRYDGKGNNDL